MSDELNSILTDGIIRYISEFNEIIEQVPDNNLKSKLTNILQLNINVMQLKINERISEHNFLTEIYQANNLDTDLLNPSLNQLAGYYLSSIHEIITSELINLNFEEQNETIDDLLSKTIDTAKKIKEHFDDYVLLLEQQKGKIKSIYQTNKIKNFNQQFNDYNQEITALIKNPEYDITFTEDILRNMIREMPQSNELIIAFNEFKTQKLDILREYRALNNGIGAAKSQPPQSMYI